MSTEPRNCERNHPALERAYVFLGAALEAVRELSAARPRQRPLTLGGHATTLQSIFSLAESELYPLSQESLELAKVCLAAFPTKVNGEFAKSIADETERAA